MASQRDYNVGKAAAVKAIAERVAIDADSMPGFLIPIIKAIIDAVDADRDKQQRERDN